MNFLLGWFFSHLNSEHQDAFTLGRISLLSSQLSPLIGILDILILRARDHPNCRLLRMCFHWSGAVPSGIMTFEILRFGAFPGDWRLTESSVAGVWDINPHRSAEFSKTRPSLKVRIYHWIYIPIAAKLGKLMEIDTSPCPVSSPFSFWKLLLSHWRGQEE